jgi:hypothetical protein
MFNAYLVMTKEIRSYKEVILDDGSGPDYDWWPMAPVVAETRGKAKSLFIRKYAFNQLHSGVETDDYTNLRTRLLEKDVDLPEGVHEDDKKLWNKIDVVLHGDIVVN